MKKTLLLKTALVAAAGVMLADGAFAADMKEVPIGVTVGGYMVRTYSFQDRGKSQTDSPSNTFGAPDAEIWFNIRGVLDNGTVVGGRVELEGSTESDQIDESYLFVEKHDIGRMELGSTDLVPNKMMYAAPNAIPGNWTSVFSDNGTAYSGNTYLLWLSNTQNDKEHINLYTASDRYLGSKAGKGLQLGVSFVPNACEDRGTSASTTGSCQSLTSSANGSTSTNATNVWAAAGNYLESFGSVDVALFGAWYSAMLSTENKRTDGWQTGGQLAYQVGDGSTVTVGGLFTREELDSVTKDKKGYSYGIQYLTNGAKPGSVGVGIEGRKVRVTNSENDLIMLGVTYQVAQGILTFAGVGHDKVDTDNSSTADNTQTFGTVGIKLNF